jgi:sigma-B regulation protein RsbU (phosphoserine phosphatase)
MFTDLVGEGIALGVDDGATYVSSRRILSCDLVLCIFSDGIIETRNSAGDLFGRDRLRNVIRQNTAHPAKAIVLSILDAVSEFRGDEEQEDDLTVMVVKTHNCDASGTC